MQSIKKAAHFLKSVYATQYPEIPQGHHSRNSDVDDFLKKLNENFKMSTSKAELEQMREIAISLCDKETKKSQEFLSETLSTEAEGKERLNLFYRRIYSDFEIIKKKIGALKRTEILHYVQSYPDYQFSVDEFLKYFMTMEKIFYDKEECVSYFSFIVDHENFFDDVLRGSFVNLIDTVKFIFCDESVCPFKAVLCSQELERFQQKIIQSCERQKYFAGLRTPFFFQEKVMFAIQMLSNENEDVKQYLERHPGLKYEVFQAMIVYLSKAVHPSFSAGEGKASFFSGEYQGSRYTVARVGRCEITQKMDDETGFLDVMIYEDSFHRIPDAFKASGASKKIKLINIPLRYNLESEQIFYIKNESGDPMFFVSGSRKSTGVDWQSEGFFPALKLSFSNKHQPLHEVPMRENLGTDLVSFWRRSHLNEEEITKILACICFEALRLLKKTNHQAYDLKPDNILIRLKKFESRVKATDRLFEPRVQIIDSSTESITFSYYPDHIISQLKMLHKNKKLWSGEDALNMNIVLILRRNKILRYVEILCMAICLSQNRNLQNVDKEQRAKSMDYFIYHVVKPLIRDELELAEFDGVSVLDYFLEARDFILDLKEVNLV